MISSIWSNRGTALRLAKNDIKNKFAGSYLGIIWAFIQPIVTVLVYWLIFEVGFKSGDDTGYPFILYLVSGIVPWFFFSDALSGGTNSLIEYSYLVKKVVFNIDILPLVKIISAFFVHIFFILIAIIIHICYGQFPSIYLLQIPYYIICNIVLLLGLIHLTSAITAFFKDMFQFVNIFVLQLGVWMTPIMWNAADRLKDHPTLLKLFKLNPVYYIVDGFRDSLLFKRWVWEGKGLWTLYFWVVTLLILFLGMRVFKKLKIHFADVL